MKTFTSLMYINDFDTIRFTVELTQGHTLQKYCANPKGFYRQKKHIIFVGDQLTGGTTRIKVAQKDIVKITIKSSYEQK
jgi:hypothetical protein